MTLEELEAAKAASLAEAAAANDAAAVEALRVKYVGRSGAIPGLVKAMKDVPKEDRPAFGKALQAWRAELEAALGTAARFRRMENGLEQALAALREGHYTRVEQLLESLLRLDQEDQYGL